MVVKSGVLRALILDAAGLDDGNAELDGVVGWTVDRAGDLETNFPGEEFKDATLERLARRMIFCFRGVGETMAVQIVMTCITYLNGVFVHKKRKPGEWETIMEPLQAKFDEWWTTMGETIMYSTHSRGVPMSDVLSSVFTESYSVLRQLPLPHLSSFEQDLVIRELKNMITSHGKHILWTMENERANRIANELLSEEGRNGVPAPGKRASRRARQRARRLATETADVLEDAMHACTVHDTAEHETTEETAEHETTEDRDEHETTEDREEQAKTMEWVATAEEEEEEEDASLCVICIDAKRTHLVAPCGHKCLCETCSTTIGGACPICRGAAVLICKVFD